jgi:hypothetical protein
MARSLFSKWFEDSEGHLALGALPNAPLITGFVSSLLAVVSDGNFAVFMRIISFGAFFAWAWLEIFQGVNYFRRVLGAVVICFLLVGAYARRII